jgi:site-specific recombinase XerD
MRSKANEFLTWLKLEQGRQPRTIEAYHFELDRFLSYLDENTITSWEAVTKSDIRNYLGRLAGTNNNSSRARALSTIKSIFNYFLREEYLRSNPTFGIDSPKVKRKEPNPLSQEMYQKLIRTVREYSNGQSTSSRDLAIITLFIGTGIRLSELQNLDWKDVDLKNGFIKVTRKGGHEDKVPLNTDSIRYLTVYEEGRDRKPGPFFKSNRNRRMHHKTIYKLIKKYIFFADLKGSPHSLRATCLTELGRIAPLPVVQAIAGHKNPNTTGRYTKAYDEDKRRAVENLKL